MVIVKSISGSWIKKVARNKYPSMTLKQALIEIGHEIGASTRTLYAIVAEDRRMVDAMEERFQEVYGKIPEEGWREIKKHKSPRGNVGFSYAPRPNTRPRTEVVQERYEDWRLGAIFNSAALSQNTLGHDLGEWIQNPLTEGEALSLELELDLEEVKQRFPHDFYKLALGEDWVTTCKKCGEIGALDVAGEEVQGIIFRISCKSIRNRSHRV
jgi:hypothetical protein